MEKWNKSQPGNRYIATTDTTATTATTCTATAGTTALTVVGSGSGHFGQSYTKYYPVFFKYPKISKNGSLLLFPVVVVSKQLRICYLVGKQLKKH